MCKYCVLSHLSNLLNLAREQVEHPQALTIELRLERVKMCTEPAAGLLEKGYKSKAISFPGQSVQASKSFTVILKLVHLVVSNLESNKISTVRDFYYQDVALFKTQNVVYRGVGQLCRYFNISRSMMNVQPSPNGLVAGDLTIALENDELLDVKRSNGSSLIPVSTIISAKAFRTPEYILIVEKEAVFSYLQAELPEGIIITGKGFPDRATKSLLIALSISYPQVPIFGLVDSDPHGLLILRNYENESDTSSSAHFQIELQYLGISLLDYAEGLVPSTYHDMRVSMSTLRKDWIYLSKYSQYKKELQRGLFMGLKGEMNLINQEKSSCLSKYVREKIAAKSLTSVPNEVNTIRGNHLPRLINFTGDFETTLYGHPIRFENVDITKEFPESSHRGSKRRKISEASAF